MTDRFNVDQFVAELPEAPPYEFDLGDQTFSMPVAKRMLWQDQVALATADQAESLRLIMGSEQYERFHAFPLPAEALEEIINRWFKHQGLNPGNSPASSPS